MTERTSVYSPKSAIISYWQEARRGNLSKEMICFVAGATDFNVFSRMKVVI